MSLATATTPRPVEVRVGSLEIRLAESPAEIAAAQQLRYRVFYQEMSAQPTPEMAAEARDFDSFDPFCDHLIIIDHDLGGGANAIVATYRLLRRDGAAKRGQFYSIDEYDISAIVDHPGEILELGRSCVDSRYRTKAAMQLLWKGITDYVMHYKVEIMFGCASLPGTDPQQHKIPLSYLYHRHLAPPEFRMKAIPSRYVDMNMLPPEAFDDKRALVGLPPLIKGYLRLGGFVGDGAVVDHQFGTTDVSIVVVTNLVTDKYYKHYTRSESGGGGGGDGPAGDSL
ncbi:MAG TPA: GNAT family N-acyltransferase [Terriglobia bacterium]|nr:GNAT family N-acyltransferase [Terriglobia bacterium]